MMILSDCWATNWRNWITACCIRLTLPKAEIRQWTLRPCSRSWPMLIPKIFILAERLKPLVNVILTLCSCLLVRKNRITARLQGSVLDFWQTPAKPCFIRWYVAWNEWEENMFLKIQEAVTLLNQEYLQAVRIKNDAPVLKGINVCTSPKVS